MNKLYKINCSHRFHINQDISHIIHQKGSNQVDIWCREAVKFPPHKRHTCQTHIPSTPHPSNNSFQSKKYSSWSYCIKSFIHIACLPYYILQSNLNKKQASHLSKSNKDTGMLDSICYHFGSDKNQGNKSHTHSPQYTTNNLSYTSYKHHFYQDNNYPHKNNIQ